MFNSIPAPGGSSVDVVARDAAAEALAAAAAAPVPILRALAYFKRTIDTSFTNGVIEPVLTNTTGTVIGSGLTRVGDDIVIGAGISFIKIVATERASATGTKSFIVQRNGAGVGGRTFVTSVSLEGWSASQLLAVSPGDVVSIGYSAGTFIATANLDNAQAVLVEAFG